MAFEMIALSTKLQQDKVEDIIRAIKKVNRLNDIKSFISFPRMDKTKLADVVFNDASLANLIKHQFDVMLTVNILAKGSYFYINKEQ